MAGTSARGMPGRVRAFLGARPKVPRLTQVRRRVVLFVVAGVAATAVDLAVRSWRDGDGAHPLLHDWWLLAVLFAAALIVRPHWGAGVAGLAAGGALALSINGEMETSYGHGWSAGFVFAFTGAVGITMLLLAQMVGFGTCAQDPTSAPGLPRTSQAGEVTENQPHG